MAFWLTAFLDVAPIDRDRDVEFWCAVTGYEVSAARGDRNEFATLAPAGGDAFLRVQRLDEGPSRIHLDLHVSSPEAAAADAVELGASVLARSGHIVLRSPGGFLLCLVGQPAAERPEAASWSAVQEGAAPASHRSIVDQVCLDIPASSYDEECAFWASLLDLRMGTSSVRSEFVHLVRDHGQPIRLLLQRLDDDDGTTRAHLDLATDDREAEVARHLSLGAVPVRRTPWWTTLRDPAGLEYCVTIRDPETGMTP